MIKPNTKEKDLKFTPLVNEFVKFLKEREAVCAKKRVFYFRGAELIEETQKNWQKLNTQSKKLCNLELNESAESHVALFQYLIDENLLTKLDRKPELGDVKIYKYPKKLIISSTTEFDSKAFYAWNVREFSQMQWLLSFGVISLLFIVCLFPIWPMSMKVFVFYTSVILLYALMGLILIRLLIFVLVRICGFSLWIFPNLFEDVGILESFYPLYSFNSNVDGLDGKLSRILGLGFLIYFVYQCQQDPQILTGYADFTKETFDDVIDWGMLRLEGKVDGITNTHRAISSFEDIMKDDNDTEILDSDAQLNMNNENLIDIDQKIDELIESDEVVNEDESINLDDDDNKKDL